jgi:hypothetical protein
MPQPICAGGTQENISEAKYIGLSNPDCQGNYLSFQLGKTVTELTNNGSAVATFPYTLANGTVITQSQYNYLQHLALLECNASTGCTPLQTCSSVGSTGTACGNTSVGANNWEFDDIAVSFNAGNGTNVGLGIYTAGLWNNNSNPQLIQLASHLHFNRVLVWGDWIGNSATDAGLKAGANNPSDAVNFSGCMYCTIGNSQISGNLRPGGEGHNILNQGLQTKIFNMWLEGMSSSYFSGGFSSAPPIINGQPYVPSQDVEIGPGMFGFPEGWLGENCSGTPGTVQNSGNGCWLIPDSNYYWGGAGSNIPTPPAGLYIPCNLGTYTANNTCVTIDSTGYIVTYQFGPPFHDSLSSWPGNVALINPTYNSSGNALQSSKNNLTTNTVSSPWPNSCTPPSPTNCYNGTGVTYVTLQNPATCYDGNGNQESCGNGDLQTFIMNGPSIVRKNGFELKSTERMVVYGVTFRNVDQSGGQSGVAATINVRNNSGGAYGVNYQTTIHDVLFLNDVFEDTCEGIGVDARSGAASDGGGTGWPMYNVWFQNILEFGLSNRNNVGCGTNSSGFVIDSGHQTWQGTVTQVSSNAATFVATYSNDAAANLESHTISSYTYGNQLLELTTADSNTFSAGEDVVFSAGSTGNVLLDGQVFAVCGATGACPLSTGNPGPNGSTFYIYPGVGYSGSALGTIQGPAGYQVLDIPTGWPAYVYNCTGTYGSYFNMGTQTITSHTISAGVGNTSLNPNLSIGSTPWNGSWNPGSNSAPGNSTITYPWTAGTNNPVNSSATCTLSNVEGGPSNLLITNFTMITDNNQPIGEGPSLSNGPTFQTSFLFRDSIIVGPTAATTSASGWYNTSPNKEGLVNQTTCTPPNCYGTENFNYDMTSMTADHLVWPGRNTTNNLYTEFGNNPNFPDYVGGCKILGCNPTITMYFPATPYCTGSTPSYSGYNTGCVGFKGAMSATSMPLYPPSGDPFDFSLLPNSPFSGKSSSGGDLGAILRAIFLYPGVNNQTSRVFTCPYPCGTPGPFKDF